MWYMDYCTGFRGNPDSNDPGHSVPKFTGAFTQFNLPNFPCLRKRCHESVCV